MNKDLADVPVVPNLTNEGKWTQIEPLVFQRPCVGQEHSASYNQNVADGHTELSILGTFSINHSIDKVVQRCRKAWYHSRYLHPETAVELSTDLSIPQMMTYRLLSEDKKEEIDTWMKETFIPVTNRSYDEILQMSYNRRLPTRGKASMMYFIVDNRPDLRDDQRVYAIVWNVSHAVTDAFSIVAFLNTFFSEVVKDTSDGDLLHSKDAEIDSIVRHLPISPLVTYEKRYNPTQAEKMESLAQAKEQLALYKDKLSESVAMYPESDFTNRDHGTHCLMTTLSLQESNNVLLALKQAQVGITYAGAAATILATYQLYGKGHETGALLGMTRNARRWVTTMLSDTGHIAIPMATDVVFLWIPFEKHLEAHKNNKKELMLSIGREIKTQLKKHLLSPHYISSVPYMSAMFVDGLRAQQQQDQQNKDDAKEDICLPSAPGFSSQGVLSAKKVITSGETVLIRHEVAHAGRHIGSSPWIGLFALDDSFRFSIGFDTKYYKVEKMTEFLNLVRANVECVMNNTPNSREISRL